MKTITMEARPESIEAITDFADRELEAVGCPLRPLMQIRVAIDELVSNIAHYAYSPGTGSVTVQFDFDPETRTVVLTFIDSGVPYDSLQNADPDVTLPVEKRRIGGLGIFLVRKTMDHMSYRRDGGRNILEIRKKI